MANHPNRSKVKDWPDHVKAFREKHALTQEELAKKLPCTKRDVENIEQGLYAPRPYLKRALRDLDQELTTTGKQQ